jgi:hypothetical protein
MKKKIFTLCVISFLLSGALSNVMAQTWEKTDTIGSDSRFKITTTAVYQKTEVFKGCPANVSLVFAEAFMEDDSFKGEKRGRDTIVIYRNGEEIARYIAGIDIPIPNTKGTITATRPLPWGSASGDVEFKVFYKLPAGVISQTEIELLTVNYKVYDSPQVIVNSSYPGVYDFFYGRTTQFPGKVELTVLSSSPSLQYSINGGAGWTDFPAGSKTVSLSALDIQNLIPGSNILVRDAYDCDKDRVVQTTLGVPEQSSVGRIISRPVFIDKSVEAHATVVPGPGIHHVPSGKDFVLKVTPKGENAGLQPTVTTIDRKIFPPDGEEDITYVDNGGGVWTVTLRGVQEALNVNISFPDTKSGTGNAAVDGNQVWGAAGAAYITSAAAGNARIYGAAGALVKIVAYPAGTTSVPLPAGFYIISKGGSENYKVVVK